MDNSKPEWMKNQQVKAYFDGLPAFVQENIMQSSVPFSSLEEIQKVAENIQKGQSAL